MIIRNALPCNEKQVLYTHCKKQTFILTNTLRDIVLSHLLSHKHKKQEDLVKSEIYILGFIVHTLEYTRLYPKTSCVMFLFAWFLDITKKLFLLQYLMPCSILKTPM